MLIREVLSRNSTLFRFLKDPQIPAEEKQSAVAEIFGSKVSGIVFNQIALVIGQGRGDLFFSIVDELLRLAAESRRKTIGKITTAIPIPVEIEIKLERFLSESLGKEVFLENSVDPSILGGFILKVNERIIDASLHGQLGRFRGEISKGFPCYR